MIDNADTYHHHDLTAHFWPQNETGDGSMMLSEKSSTFHGSAQQPDQLSYMLLFTGANPRWDSDGIVFAKTALSLLPEYAAKKAENGPWDLPTVRRKSRIEGLADDNNEGDPNAEASQLLEENSNGLHQDAENAPIAAHASLSSRNGAATGTDLTSSSTSDTNTQDTDTAPTFEVPTSPSDVNTVPASDLYLKNEVPLFPSRQPIDYTPGHHTPIAVFAERYQGHKTSKKKFRFEGWYSVARINILAPQSAELVRMQQQKWERRDRFGIIMPSRPREIGAWESALGHEWAVVKFEKLIGDAAPPAPVIEKHEWPEKQGGDVETKGVTEMLEELRLKDNGSVNIAPEKVEGENDTQSGARNVSLGCQE
ncbi:hypothetical protein BJ170DRAFT_685610 [Xylariales sp. AK1849]|nr:hypothetical protein BJ170DRAFT_685610 [Xylariales sp. AK1849]